MHFEVDSCKKNKHPANPINAQHFASTVYAKASELILSNHKSSRVTMLKTDKTDARHTLTN